MSDEWSVPAIIAWLEERADPHAVLGMQRYAIRSDRMFGVSLAQLRPFARQIGRNHGLALDLWMTEVYEARLLAAFLAEPKRLTPDQMEAWAEDFDNWAICDGACIHLFSRSDFAWSKVHAWAVRDEEFVRRAGFALLAALTTHDKKSGPQPFLDALPLIRAASEDPRNFVKKAVNWALRSYYRPGGDMRGQALTLAQELAASTNKTARWIGKDALREFEKKSAATSGGPS